MLPNAEGWATGLQLSAKDVVLGRPDMLPILNTDSNLCVSKEISAWSLDF